MRTQNKLPEQGVDTREQVVIGLGFESDYLRKWWEFSEPVTQ